jgi:hypothetical protein
MGWELNKRPSADGSVFVFVEWKMMECAFAAVKSVSPSPSSCHSLPSSTKPAKHKHARVMRLEKETKQRTHAATISSPNIYNDSTSTLLSLSLSSTSLIQSATAP